MIRVYIDSELETPEEIKITKRTYPSGEFQFSITSAASYYTKQVFLSFQYQKNPYEIYDLISILRLLENCGYVVSYIEMKYLPFSREDKAKKLELDTLDHLMCLLSKYIVYVWDIHSHYLFEKQIIPYVKQGRIKLNNLSLSTLLQTHKMFGIKYDISDYVYISPDKGAEKRVLEISKNFPSIHNIIVCSKIRNSEGRISSLEIPEFWHTKLQDKKCIIFDDICGEGGTFIELSNKLKNLGVSKVVLVVTHFFSETVSQFKKIDEIYVGNRISFNNDLPNGRIK